MSLIKFAEKSARKVKTIVGEPALLKPLIKKIRAKYNDPAFEAKKLKHIIIPEVKEAFLKVTGETLPEPILNEALGNYAMTHQFDKYHAGDFDIVFLYCLIRHMQPKVVIETGICSGRSSSSMLEALKENGKGVLYSIDLPRTFEGGGTHLVQSSDGEREYHSTLAEGAEEPGWLVPEHLKTHWNKILGDSNVELPKLVETLDHIDIFYHDSDHTYETMTNEMTTAWAKMSEGAIMIVDDATCTNAYEDFKAKHQFAAEHLYSGFGIIKK